MPDAIMLSPETYDRLKRFLDDWDNGLEKTLQLGAGLKFEERGTGYVKIGTNGHLGGSGASLVVTNTNINVQNVTTISLDQYLFKLTSSGAGIANITLNTTTCP